MLLNRRFANTVLVLLVPILMLNFFGWLIPSMDLGLWGLVILLAFWAVGLFRIWRYH